jgi:hypothetical protein
LIVPIDYDPAEHELIDCQEARHLRGATGFDNLIVYRHRGYSTWVVALRAKWPDGRIRFAEVGMLGSGEGEGRWLTKANRDDLVFRLRNLMTKEDIKRGLRQFQRGLQDWLDEVDDDQQSGIQSLYNGVKRRYGQVAAERYKRQCAGAARIRG